MTIVNQNNRNSAGFSLVELLVVLAIIGSITAFALPTISNISAASNAAKAKANARNIAMISAELNALGVNHVLPDSDGGLEDTIYLIRSGITVPEGPMAGEVIILAGISDGDINAMLQYLQLRRDPSETWIEYLPDF